MKENFSFERVDDGRIYLIKDNKATCIYSPYEQPQSYWPDGFWLYPVWAVKTCQDIDTIEIEEFYHNNRESIIAACKHWMIKEML